MAFSSAFLSLIPLIPEKGVSARSGTPELMDLEMGAAERYVETISAFESAYDELSKKTLEQSTNFFQKLRDLEAAYNERLLAAGAELLEKMNQAGGENSNELCDYVPSCKLDDAERFKGTASCSRSRASYVLQRPRTLSGVAAAEPAVIGSLLAC